MRSIVRDYDWNPRRLTQELQNMREAEFSGKSQGTLGGLANTDRINEAISEFMGKSYIYGAPTEVRGGRRGRLGDPRQLGGPNTPFEERPTPNTMDNKQYNR